MKLRFSFLAALFAAISARPGAGARRHPGLGDANAVRYYLSLGDSLAESFEDG